jgi:chromosome partitioning protein
MAGMRESCSVCAREFDVQFRYQMEESRGGFAFYCSHDCQGKSVRGEATGGVCCDVCGKRFVVELVSQVVKTRSGRTYACGESCRSQALQESPLGRSLAAASVAHLPRPALLPVPPQERAAAPSLEESGPVPIVAPVRNVKYAGPKKLAIFNHKGGTGKTTTTVSVAAGLAARGLKVLLVDTDSQGNVGVSLGVKLEKSLYHVLVMGVKPEDVVVKVRENLDFIGCNETLAAAELYLAGRQNRDRVLRERLAKISEAYDVVVVDCSPSLSLMNQNALVLADAILVPVACDFLSLVGVRQVVKTVKNVNSLLRHPVQIYGVLPTFYDARAKICREAVDTLKGHFGDRCLPPIRSATKIKEAPWAGQTIFEYAPDSNASEDYLRIVDQLVTGQVANQASDPASERAEYDYPESIRVPA